VEKGKAFETTLKQLLEGELNRGDLGIKAGSAKVFARKSYPSADRGRSIVMDVSLELYRRGAEEPFFVWVWECKDYERSVPVDDIEEFHAKLEQIGLHKTKGTVACRNGFQISAINYARAKGIGLARVLPDGSTIRLLEAIRTVSEYSVHLGLTELDTQQLESMFYGLSSSGRGIMSFSDMVLAEINEAMSLSNGH